MYALMSARSTNARSIASVMFDVVSTCHSNIGTLDWQVMESVKYVGHCSVGIGAGERSDTDRTCVDECQIVNNIILYLD